MTRLILLLSLFVLALPLQAQEPWSDPPTTEYTDIAAVEVDDAWVTIEWHSRECFDPQIIQEQQGDVLRFWFLETETPEDIVCDAPASGDESVLLPRSWVAGREYVLWINEAQYVFSLAAPGDDAVELHSAPRLDVAPQQVSGTREGDTLTLTLEGAFPADCVAVQWEQPDQADPDRTHLTLFFLSRTQEPCTEAAETTSFTFYTTIFAGIPKVVTLHSPAPVDYVYSPAQDSLTPIYRETLRADSVSFEAQDEGWLATVSGVFGGDCPVEAQVFTWQELDGTHLEISRDIPLAMTCLAGEVPYETQVEVSTLPLVVDGQRYTPDFSAQADEGNLMRVDHVIENVEAVVLESYPMQIQLTVTGYQPDGCRLPVIVEQQRVANTVTVHIYRTMPEGAICPMMIMEYEETIRLDGGFESGSYTIRVNDFTLELDL